MKVLILAGGLGTRLRQLAGDVPKPMVEVRGKPFLQWQLEYLRSQGITDMIISVGYKADSIVSYFGNGDSLGVRISYSYESEPLGTGGAVKKAGELLHGEENFIVMNGDTYLLLDLKGLMDSQVMNSAIATIVIMHADITQKAGLVKIDDRSRVISINEVKSGSGYINAGVSALNRKILEMMPELSAFSLEYDLYPALIGTQGVYAFKYSGYFRDIGTPEGYFSFTREVSDVVG